jgi:hypothetical protein
MLRFGEFLAVTRTGAKADNHAVLYTHPRTTSRHALPHAATASPTRTAKPSAVTTISRVSPRAHLGLDPRLLHTPPVRDERRQGRRPESREVMWVPILARIRGVSSHRRVAAGNAGVAGAASAAANGTVHLCCRSGSGVTRAGSVGVVVGIGGWKWDMEWGRGVRGGMSALVSTRGWQLT